MSYKNVFMILGLLLISNFNLPQPLAAFGQNADSFIGEYKCKKIDDEANVFFLNISSEINDKLRLSLRIEGDGNTQPVEVQYNATYYKDNEMLKVVYDSIFDPENFYSAKIYHISDQLLGYSDTVGFINSTDRQYTCEKINQPELPQQDESLAYLSNDNNEVMLSKDFLEILSKFPPMQPLPCENNNDHMLNDPSNKTCFPCTFPGCKKKCLSDTALKYHTNSVHLKVKYSCTFPGCNMELSQKSSVYRHLKAIHLKKKYLCPLCNKESKQKSDLKLHMEEAHGGKRYPCPECSNAYRQKHSLKLHMNEAHEGKRYPCPECNNAYRQKHGLKKHMNAIHKGVKYYCSVCNGKFSAKSSLNVHNATIHNSHRKYTCPTCQKQFKNLDQLNTHQKLHHNDSQ